MSRVRVITARGAGLNPDDGKPLPPFSVLTIGNPAARAPLCGWCEHRGAVLELDRGYLCATCVNTLVDAGAA